MRIITDCYKINHIMTGEYYVILSLIVWLLNMLSKAPENTLIKISTVLWSIWFARNKQIFESKNMPPAVGILWSKRQIDEWQVANKKSGVLQNSRENSIADNIKWKPPEVDQLKINVDAALTTGQNSYAVGMVIRNHHSQYKAGKIMRFAGMVSVLEAELKGILEAILWAQEIAGCSVTIESDSLISTNAINHGHDSSLEAEDLVQQCQEVLSNNSRISVRHVKKQANKVAHNLARVPCERNCFIVFSSPPSCLLGTLLSDALEF